MANRKSKIDNRKGGTREWSDHSCNIQLGCANDCRYCYARFDAVRRFKLCRRADWSKPVIRQGLVDSFRSPGVLVRDGRCRPCRVMLPTTHDIDEGNITEICVVLKKLLASGNEVVLVSKPRVVCMRLIFEMVLRMSDETGVDYRDKLLLRFTIGSVQDHVLAFWDPGAPDFGDRRSCLIEARAHGFRTSISIEPYLDAFCWHVVDAFEDLITDDIWVGLLRNWKSRLDLDGVTPEEMRLFVEPLKAAQSPQFVLEKLVPRLGGHPKVRWKDSIRKMIERQAKKRRVATEIAETPEAKKSASPRAGETSPPRAAGEEGRRQKVN